MTARARGAGSVFPLRVDSLLLNEDLAHATPAAATEIKREIEHLRKTGVPATSLRRCDAEGRDGTTLEGCVKRYIPLPVGRFGAVFQPDWSDEGPILVLLAVGERHPKQPWRPSVYEIAHRRLHSE